MAGPFRLLSDEHIPYSLVRALRERGWDVVRVVDEPRLGQRTSDEIVFAFAIEKERVVLSSDEHALWRPKVAIEQGLSFPGLIVWTQRDRNRMRVGEAIAQIETMVQEDTPFITGIRYITPTK